MILTILHSHKFVDLNLFVASFHVLKSEEWNLLSYLTMQVAQAIVINYSFSKLCRMTSKPNAFHLGSAACKF